MSLLGLPFITSGIVALEVYHMSAYTNVPYIGESSIHMSISNLIATLQKYIFHQASVQEDESSSFTLWSWHLAHLTHTIPLISFQKSRLKNTNTYITSGMIPDECHQRVIYIYNL